MGRKIFPAKKFGMKQSQRSSMSPIAQTLIAALSVTIITYAYKYRPITAIEYIIDELTNGPRPAEPPEPERTPERKIYGGKTPRDTVLALISELKANQDPTNVLNYVWWDAAFGKLNETQKKYIGVRSPQSLRRFYQEMFTNPNMFIIREAAKHLAELPPDRQQRLLEMMKPNEGAAVPAPPYTQILNELFEIKTETISGDSAEVELSVTQGGKNRVERIQLLKVLDRWMLTCFQIVEDPLHLCGRQ